jgi:hypothetical protein
MPQRLKHRVWQPWLPRSKSYPHLSPHLRNRAQFEKRSLITILPCRYRSGIKRRPVSSLHRHPFTSNRHLLHTIAPLASESVRLSEDYWATRSVVGKARPLQPSQALWVADMLAMKSPRGINNTVHILACRSSGYSRWLVESWCLVSNSCFQFCRLRNTFSAVAGAVNWTIFPSSRACAMASRSAS